MCVYIYHVFLQEMKSFVCVNVTADPGGGRKAQGDFPRSCLPFYAQRDGGPVSSSGAHSDCQKLPPWLWE